jgi:phage head maturation protease
MPNDRTDGKPSRRTHTDTVTAATGQALLGANVVGVPTYESASVNTRL